MDSQIPAESSESKLHFLDYWRIIRLRKAVIVAVFLLVVITTTVVTFFLPVSYSSKVRISVEKDATDVSGIDVKQAQSQYDPFWIQTQFEKLRSSSILDEVIVRLNLVDEWTRRLSPEHKLRLDEAREILVKLMDVKPERNTSILTVEIYDDNRDEAAAIANMFAEVYKDSRINLRKKTSQRGIDILKGQLKEKDQELLRAQAIVNEMRETNNIPDLFDSGSGMTGPTLNTETMRRLEEIRIQANAEYVAFDTLLKRILQLTPDQQKRALVTALPDQELTSLSEALSSGQQRLNALLQDFSPDHPDVKRAQRVVDTVQEQMDDKLKGIILGLTTRVESLKARLDEIKSQVDKARKDDIELAAKYRPYFDAKHRLDNLQRIRDALNLRVEQELVELKLPTESIVEVIEKAEPGREPVKPRKKLNIALGAIVGLIVGVGLAFFIEYLDTSVKTIDDVERALQAPVLGVIPQNVGSLLEEGPESPHAEAYRVLRTNVLFSRKNENLRTLSVISGGAGEGKSTTLLNLATIFAQNGHRVVVVDSDLRRPSIHKVLRLSNSIGLTNYLLKQNSLEEVIQTTKLPTLDFLPSGKLPSSSMGILSSAQMKDLIQELKRRYDFAFFDSPPIMGVSDASILASEVDLVLQVIQYRRYPQPMTIRAKQMIQKVGGNLLGIVLNNINMSQDENYYYYSGYYHDYYSANSDEDSGKPGEKKKSAKEQPIKAEIKSKF
jgi:succinoglycan biosynthesis transport protein ExoP